MPQQVNVKSVNTFVKGLITEASPLTFPENSSVDELNCSLERSGVRRRRKGIEYEDSFSLSSFTFTPGTLVHSITWENVAGLTGVEFLVVQIGATLYFYDKSSAPISGSEKSFSVNLNTFNAGNGEVVADNRIAGASINGNFVVVSKALKSFFIEYDATADSISTTIINPKVRDFDWQGDTSEYAEDVAVGLETSIRKYDTYNAGWIDKDNADRDVLFGSDEGLVTREHIWPRLTHPWYIGKTGTSKFLKGDWKKAYEGNTLIGNGHFILDLYNKDRSAISGVSGLTTEVDNTRFSAVIGSNRRVWFAGLSSKQNGSRVFFSPIIENMAKIGNFYQEADPTVETISDLIDSDGGAINIPAASNIISLFEWGSSVLVFAENGVWEIKGVDGVFKATEFAVSRISKADGITNSAALIDAEGSPYWWGKTGIYTIVPNQDLTSAAATQGENISLATIQTFWEAIPGALRNEAVGNFDEANNRVFWLYGDDTSVSYKYTKVIILDISLGAFIPWEFSNAEATAEVLLHAKTWGTVAPVAQSTGTDHGSGTWVFNRGTVALGTGSGGSLSGLPVVLVTSTDTDGTMIESETGRIGTYIDLVDEGHDPDITLAIRKSGIFRGISGQAAWQFKMFQADSGGSATVAEQELSFMPPDAHNIVEILNSGFQIFPGPVPVESGETRGRYYSYVIQVGSPNLGSVEVGPVNLFISGVAAPYPVGMDFFSGLGGSTITSNVTSASGVNNVTSASGVNNVVSSKFISTTVGNTEMKFLTRDTTGALTFSTITEASFLDWGTNSFDSYAEAAYDFQGDMTTNKQGVYVTTYFDVTETGFNADLVTMLNPSSCILKAFWDLKTSPNSSQEAYRFRIPVVADAGDLTAFNYPYASVVSRNRIRGRGRNLKLRFESVASKDFQLQGYEVIGAKNQGL